MINQKGQSLVEALIALGVAAIVVSAMAVAAITAVNNADFSKYQNLATQYAQQGLEILKQQSQTDWNAFSSQVGGSPGNLYCLDQDKTKLDLPPLGSCAQNINDQNNKPFFVRDVRLTQTDPADLDCHGIVRVTVRVSWTDGKCSSTTDYCHKVSLKSCFANINAVPGQ
jgi:type II secretory pathway pseudopilin PulG